MLEKLRTRIGVSASAYILLGLALLLFPGAIAEIAPRLIGAVALIYGVTHISSYSKPVKDSLKLGIAIIITVAGALLLMNPRFIVSALPTILGLYILLSGAGELRSALDMRSHGYSRWVTSFVLSLIMIIVGIVIIANPFGAIKISLMVFGGAMVASGAAELMGKA